MWLPILLPIVAVPVAAVLLGFDHPLDPAPASRKAGSGVGVAARRGFDTTTPRSQPNFSKNLQKNIENQFSE